MNGPRSQEQRPTSCMVDPPLPSLPHRTARSLGPSDALRTPASWDTHAGAVLAAVLTLMASPAEANDWTIPEQPAPAPAPQPYPQQPQPYPYPQPQPYPYPQPYTYPQPQPYPYPQTPYPYPQTYPQPYPQQPYPQQPYPQQPCMQQPCPPQPYPQQPIIPAEEPEPEPPFFDLAVGTAFPLGLGPQLSLELPARILLQGELGWMPAAYGSAVVGIMSSVGEQDALLGPVVEDALADSFVWRLSLGWRPFPSVGFEITAGYTGLAVSGDIPPQAIVDVITGFVDEDTVDLTQLTEDAHVSTTLHNFHVALGWRFLAVDDHLVIRASIGYTQTVGSSSSLEMSQFPEIASIVRPIFEERLDEIVRSDVKLPVLSLTIGYRF
jgi:hypothetical protein